MMKKGSLLPIDGYKVKLPYNLTIDYTNSLIHLYQPLVGIDAISLYLTLLHDKELQEVIIMQTHHSLMNQLNMSLDDIFDARTKLEAIGLMKSSQHCSDEKTFYTYELISPFVPQKFFQDMMLSELLYRHLGKSKFQQLKMFYVKEEHDEEGEDTTASFNDVFQTFKPSQTDIVHINKLQSKNEFSMTKVESIDFSFIQQSLERQKINGQQVLTTENKKIIGQLMKLYDLEAYELEKAIQWALTDENRLDIEQLKAGCHDLFQGKYNVANVQLHKKQRLETKNPRKSLSKEDQMIHRFETITPKQLLEDLSSGRNASEQDMRIVSEVMTEQGLPIPVMNVLIHYVLLQSNMKLSKPYMNKIASHWSRARLTTAKDAINFARNEINRRQTTVKKTTKATKQKEIIPDWFKEQKANQKSNPIDTKLTAEEEQEKAEMLAMLQKHAEE